MKRELCAQPLSLPDDVWHIIGALLLAAPAEIDAAGTRWDHLYQCFLQASRYSRASRRHNATMRPVLTQWRDAVCCLVCLTRRGQVHCNCLANEECRFSGVANLKSRPNTLCMTCAPLHCSSCSSGSCGCIALTQCYGCPRLFCDYCVCDYNCFRGWRKRYGLCIGCYERSAGIND